MACPFARPLHRHRPTNAGHILLSPPQLRCYDHHAESRLPPILLCGPLARSRLLLLRLLPSTHQDAQGAAQPLILGALGKAAPGPPDLEVWVDEVDVPDVLVSDAKRALKLQSGLCQLERAQ